MNARRARLKREVDERLELKRQHILSLMDEEARAEYADADVVTLILLRNTGRLNMLPGMD